MGNGNTLAGADEMKRPSIRVHKGLLDEFDGWVAESDRFDNRTQALRALMRDAADGEPDTGLMPRDPPVEDRLAIAYRKLCQAAYPNGIIRPKTAERVCSNGPDNLSKQEVRPLVLHPLKERGYIGYRADRIYGTVRWEIHGWEK